MQLQQIRLRLTQLTQEEKNRQTMALHNRSSRETSSRDSQVLDELGTLEARTTRLERADPLAAAQGPPPSGYASLQLQGAPGYREAYRALTILRQGLRIAGGPVEVSVKDVHLLYEYWCFLGIVRLVATILETPIPADRLLEVRTEGLRIRLQKGRAQSVPFELPGGRKIEVTYNPSYTNADALLPQQPDLVLTLTDPNWPTVRLVLDAKYRVEEDAGFLQRFGAPGPPADAVNVLHRYRDAILETERIEGASAPRSSRPRRNVIEGAALYPLSAERASNFGESRFWHSLERLGIGAIPFLPGSTAWLERWLRGVLHRSGWAVAEAVISHAAEAAQARWKRSAELPVMIGVLRGESPEEHMAWIRDERKYYTRLTPSQPRQLRVSHVAYYEPAALHASGEPGRVRLYSRVEEIEVIRRDEIATPWPARRSGEELYVVYRLGGIQELASPILNRRATGQGQPFATNRWSSVLGLERAGEISELLLESAAEWEVYDALQAHGIKFDLQVAQKPRDNVGGEGRAWFVTGGKRVRVRDPETVEIHQAGKIYQLSLRQLPAILRVGSP